MKDGDEEKSLISVLKNPQLLRCWAQLSLDHRCAILKEKFQIEMSRYTLANIYKELKIGYMKTHATNYSSRSLEEYNYLIL